MCHDSASGGGSVRHAEGGGVGEVTEVGEWPGDCRSRGWPTTTTPSKSVATPVWIKKCGIVTQWPGVIGKGVSNCTPRATDDQANRVCA
eukprot:m.223448 g.223448  ORF g.223448 m.223448 type:complete len:89 (+) comp25846_c0_seq4:1710-1976(+)